ncbi:MAG: hypothetical protein M0R21_00060 [Lentimicrobiaceae bacterium]|jgi:hypothetical protein|nr:hypothetical protein [Lentimicrobiaceae bacterium]
MYILKNCGSSRIPEYVQLRDTNFTLVAYFCPENTLKALTGCNMVGWYDQISEIIHDLPYGRIYQLEY